MTTTKAKYSPSVNIIRDSNGTLNYIPTPNSKLVYKQIIENYRQGVHSFSLIGAYGSGKSSFLLAFEQSLNGQKIFFDNQKNKFLTVNSFTTISIVGSYDSLISSFSQQLTCLSKPKKIIETLEKIYFQNLKNNKGLLLLIDEFGKFLEYAAHENPFSEIYFIQQLAEFINDKHIILITSLHQDFKSYSYGLNRNQVQEWDKVKGRLKEVTFNEPVEQLLFLLSERIPTINSNIKPNKNISSLFNFIKDSKTFSLKDYFDLSIAKKILPFDILSASVLTLALQKYGQNERSIFSFLELEEPFGLKDFLDTNKSYYSISNVCDYLMYNYRSFLFSRFNPHSIQWLSIQNSLDQVEQRLDEEMEDGLKLIKVIGVLNLFSPSSAIIDKQFLKEYSKLCLGISNAETIIHKLEANKIIRFSKFKNKYILFEWTDLNIDLAIDEAGKLIPEAANVVPVLKEYFDDEYIQAKSVFYELGTPRVFKFVLSDEPLVLSPENEIDGFVNLIFSEKLENSTLKEMSSKCKEAILFGKYYNTSEIKNLLYLIERIKKVKEENYNDSVALRELDIILGHQKNLLVHYLFKNIFSDKSNILWIYKGKEVEISNKKNFNKKLSEICRDVYYKTPLYHNELINRTKLSGQISNAKKVLLNSLIENYNQKDLGFDQDKFPPEKTIYLSLLQNTGIHKSEKEYYFLDEPSDKSFKELWIASGKFLDSAIHSRRSLNELMDLLLSKPFKLKKGFIDFWIPIFLIVKKEEYALFREDSFIPNLNKDIFELLTKNPHKFFIKSFDVTGIRLEVFNKYRELLNKSSELKISKSGFIDTLKPFLVFYKNLSEYSKKTSTISKKAKRIREAICNTKDFEETFFEDFPMALDYKFSALKNNKRLLQNYVDDLQKTIREINNSFPLLVDRIQKFISNYLCNEDLPFDSLKNKITKRYSTLKENILPTKDKALYNRLISESNDYASWISSISHLILNKSLETISDHEEDILYDKLRDFFNGLDNLCDMSLVNGNGEEEIIQFNISSFNDTFAKNIIRYPKTREKEVNKLKNKISKSLSEDKNVNKAALIKILREQI